jgi:hypothetical protein
MAPAYVANMGQEAAYAGMPAEVIPASRKARNTCCSSMRDGKKTAAAKPQTAPLASALMPSQRSHWLASASFCELLR